ncbi:glycosyltransferase [Marinilabiliaceae bacterium ANBcel2]|nr:glycosyltransferase [Marinilabiliaceae bacterium ANBcel2]
MQMPLYTIVIPVYKSAKSLEIISEQVNELQQRTDYKFEIIFVNDSPFFLDTCKTLTNLQKEYSNVKAITLRKNQGQHTALLVGMSQAKGDYIINMDDDLQHPVNEIPKLIEAITTNPMVEAVFGVPKYSQKKHSLWRNTGSYILNKIDTWFLKKPEGLIKSPFRIMTGDLIKVVVNNYNATPSVSSLIIHATNNIINIEIIHQKREYGKSNYTLRKLISLTLNNILHYSSLPLKAVGFIGVIGFVFSMLFILHTIFRYFYWGIDFPGYASTVSLISFFGGLNLFALGMIGEYLVRIIKEQQKSSLEDMIKRN